MASLKLYFTGSATGNAVSQVIIPSRGRLKGIQISAGLQTDQDTEFRLEVSKASATEIGVNGSQQCICEVDLCMSGTTTPASLGNAQFNGFIPLDVDVVQGQIIYLHAVKVGGSGTYSFAGNIIY